MLILTRNKNSEKVSVKILQSVSSSQHTREFQLVTGGAEHLVFEDDVISAAFADLNQDGALDLVISTQQNTLFTSKLFTTIFINQFHLDAFFLKGLILTACNECAEEHFGSPLAGGVFKYTLIVPTN